MKNEDLFYAMSFIDEDLIDEADKDQKKATVTPVRKKSKAKIIPLIGSFAAAAAVLIIGGIILFSIGISSSTKEASSQGARISVGPHNGIVDGDAGVAGEVEDSNDGGNYSASVATPEDGVESIDDLFEDSDGGNDSELIIEAEPYLFGFMGDTYILADELPDDETIADIRGEELGTIEETDLDELEGMLVFEYIGEEERVIVYDADNDLYYVAMRLET